MSRYPQLALALALALATTTMAQEKSAPPKGRTAAKLKADAVPGYKVQAIEGFTVLISAETQSNHDSSQHERKPLAVLELELKTISSLMPPRALNALRNILIWVEWDEDRAMSNGRGGRALAVYYGGHQLSLLAQGQHPLKSKNVTILRMKSLTEEHQPKRDSGRCVILHEIAHAVHDQVLGDENQAINAAYKQALERKLYDPTLYVATNEHEFFAELTCAYFDQLHHFPRTRADLKKHDPVSFKLLEGVWGKTKLAKTEAIGGTTGDPDLKLSALPLGQQVVGAKVETASLRERPALLLFWNASSSDSVATLPRVATWHRELGDFGLRTVAIHLTGTTAQDVAAAVRTRDLPYPVTEARWVNGFPVKEFRDFPQAIVFDHEGTCVHRGSTSEAEVPLRAALGRYLAAAHEAYPPLMNPTVEALRKGQSPGGLLARVATSARSPDAATSAAGKALLDRLTATGREALEAAQGQLKDDPVGAYLQLERLPTTFKDTPVATKANELLGKLKQDKAVAAELRARMAFAQVKKLDTELSSKAGSFDPTQPTFRRANAALLGQLQENVTRMKKAHPAARATEQAVAIAERYGLSVK